MNNIDSVLIISYWYVAMNWKVYLLIIV